MHRRFGQVAQFILFLICHLSSISVAEDPKNLIYDFDTPEKFSTEFSKRHPAYTPSIEFQSLVQAYALEALQSAEQTYRAFSEEKKKEAEFNLYRSQFVERMVLAQVGIAALHWNAAQGNFAGVKALLDDGIQVDAKKKTGETALFYASMKGKAEIVSYLLSRGADRNVKDERGGTAFSAALVNGQLNVVKVLVEAGEKVNQSLFDEKAGVTPLILAAQNGSAELVTYLLSQGAEIKTRTRDQYQTNALSQAIFNARVDAARVLAKAGGEYLIYRRKKDRGMKLSVLKTACEVSRSVKENRSLASLPCKKIEAAKALDTNSWVCGDALKPCP